MRAGPPSPDFDRLAASYDRLRPQDGAWWQRFDALVEVLAVRGGRVLDVGCGTGALAAALAERAHARVWGVDTSAEMLEVARGRVPRAVGLKQGRAEELPFRDGWFDAVVLSLVVHLVDRRPAFAEAARVLGPGGRLGIATFAPEHFDSYWLNPWFPGIAEVDRRRFPTPPELERELAAAGFEDVRFVPLEWNGVLDREDALERIRGRHISSFDLLDEEAIRAGSERAERELPQRVETRLVQLVVGASVSA
ncbi:MAG TPA: methyltransferase domain-containing protein [Gaiellaceae bacterium]|nr:methyltransferase domain-containing protein [Gaiellaceae bacterium]